MLISSLVNRSLHVFWSARYLNLTGSMSAFVYRTVSSVFGRASKLQISKKFGLQTSSSLKSCSMHKIARQFGSFATIGSRRMIHSEADRDFSEHLQKEIEGEKRLDYGNKDEYFRDWKKEVKATKVNIWKQIDNEKVKVTIDLGEAVIWNSNEEGQEGTLVCRPPFDVEIEKPSGMKMQVFCKFVEDVDHDSETPSESGDRFEIQGICVFRGENSDESYLCKAESMDGDVYEKLMDMLDERKIDNNFVENLEKFSTIYDHKEYIDFLTRLKSFVDEK